jgi:hypothetical protein
MFQRLQIKAHLTWLLLRLRLLKGEGTWTHVQATWARFKGRLRRKGGGLVV